MLPENIVSSYPAMAAMGLMGRRLSNAAMSAAEFRSPEHSADAAALWVMHTYLLDAFHISPRLAIASPEKQCGKTTLIDVTHALGVASSSGRVSACPCLLSLPPALRLASTSRSSTKTRPVP